MIEIRVNKRIITGNNALCKATVEEMKIFGSSAVKCKKSK